MRDSSTYCSTAILLFFFFCEVLTTSRSGCIGRPSAVELARYEQTLNASREKYPMCRLTYNAFRNVDTDSSSFMEEELIYCLVNGKRWVNSWNYFLVIYYYNVNLLNKWRIRIITISKKLYSVYVQINEQKYFLYRILYL